MDGHPRQNPAYRPATESPRTRGLSNSQVLSATSSVVPTPGLLETVKSAPIESALLRMFFRPCPAVGLVSSSLSPSPSSRTTTVRLPPLSEIFTSAQLALA